MSAVTTVWRQLVQRRLWPVAIILIAALAAVPLTLAEDPETQPAPPVAQADEGILATQPIVAMASEADRSPRRVLGESKNPFAMPKKPKSSASTAGPSDVKSPKSQGAGGGLKIGLGGSDTPAGSGGTPTTGGSPTPAPVDTTPEPRPRTYDKYELTVRFGDSSGDLERMSLKRLQPLPKDELPAVVYLGVSKDRKSAVFLLEKGVQAVGDGVCHPTPQACETVKLAVGETEFFDVVDESGTVSAMYQLDLVKIHRATTSSAAEASASSRAGRELLADRDGRLPYRYDAGSGTLEGRPAVVGTAGRVTASIAE